MCERIYCNVLSLLNIIIYWYIGKAIINLAILPSISIPNSFFYKLFGTPFPDVYFKMHVGLKQFCKFRKIKNKMMRT
jgi:hypothetical protein